MEISKPHLRLNQKQSYFYSVESLPGDLMSTKEITLCVIRLLSVNLTFHPQSSEFISNISFSHAMGGQQVSFKKVCAFKKDK
jgi:hypothetical protein